MGALNGKSSGALNRREPSKTRRSQYKSGRQSVHCCTGELRARGFVRCAAHFREGRTHFRFATRFLSLARFESSETTIVGAARRSVGPSVAASGALTCDARARLRQVRYESRETIVSGRVAHTNA